MTTSVESAARPLTQLEVIRRHIDSAELGEGHNHAEFETCEECEQAMKSVSYLQVTGWQNAILMMREIQQAFGSLCRSAVAIRNAMVI